MLNEVEVSKSLLENQKRDFQIRKENCKAQIYSQYKKFEIAVDEIIDTLQDQKNNFLKEFEKKGEKMLNGIQDQEASFESQVNYFSSVLDQVNSLKKNSQNPEEEIFNFFFGNQESIFEALQK